MSISNQEFLERLIYHIDIVGGQWRPGTLELAHRYATSLVKGTGELPTGLSEGTVTEMVRSRFALTCIAGGIDVEQNSMPGIQRGWFEPTYRAAWAQRSPLY